MKNDYIYKEMCKLKADGVDFVPILGDEVYRTYTKEECKNGNGFYPRSGRKYWKLVDGQKQYI